MFFLFNDVICFILTYSYIDFHVHFLLLLSERAHLKGSSKKKGALTENFEGTDAPLPPPPIPLFRRVCSRRLTDHCLKLLKCHICKTCVTNIILINALSQISPQSFYGNSWMLSTQWTVLGYTDTNHTSMFYVYLLSQSEIDYKFGYFYFAVEDEDFRWDGMKVLSIKKT